MSYRSKFTSAPSSLERVARSGWNPNLDEDRHSASAWESPHLGRALANFRVIGRPASFAGNPAARGSISPLSVLAALAHEGTVLERGRAGFVRAHLYLGRTLRTARLLPASFCRVSVFRLALCRFSASAATAWLRSFWMMPGQKGKIFFSSSPDGCRPYSQTSNACA